MVASRRWRSPDTETTFGCIQQVSRRGVKGHEEFDKVILEGNLIGSNDKQWVKRNLNFVVLKKIYISLTIEPQQWQWK